MSELWYGFSMQTIVFEDKKAIIVFPKEGTANGRLAVKTEYWGAFPEAVEVGLLEKGFHLCFVENNTRWGGEVDLDRKARFVRYVAQVYGLSEKTVPVGMSCGGLIAIKFAAKYPELVSCLYLDAPVLNYLSCPCGLGSGEPSDNGECLRILLEVYGLSGMSQLIGYRDMPLDKVPQLVANKIPVVMVAGGSDPVVPYHENGAYLQQAYEQAGVECQVHIKPECAHHPHGLPTPDAAVNFILRHV